MDLAVSLRHFGIRVEEKSREWVVLRIDEVGNVTLGWRGGGKRKHWSTAFILRILRRPW